MRILRYGFILLAAIGLSAVSASAETDVTERLANPSFESGTGSWTLTKNVSGWEDFKTTTAAPSDGSKIYNLWAQKITSLDLHQSVTLPAGNYRLSADLRINTMDDVTDQHVYATVHGATHRSAATITHTASPWETVEGWNTLTTDFDVLYDGTAVVVGAASTGSGTTAGWFQVDNFRLTLLGHDIDIPDDTLPRGNCRILFSETDGALQDNYTIALNKAVLAAAGDTAWVLLRNTAMQGVMLPLTAPDTTPHDWRVCISGAEAAVWCDGQSVGNHKVRFLPKLTEAGERSEITLVGSERLTKYSVELISEREALAPGGYAVNNYGRTVRNVLCMQNTILHFAEPVDVWVPSADTLLVGSTLNLQHEEAWLLTPHWMPSEAISHLLPSVYVNARKGVNGSNLRVAIYLDGAVVIPQTDDCKPFSGFAETSFGGDETRLGLGCNNELGPVANTLRSFVLKRGYMVTLATNADGSGYSRVYVADHDDVRVEALPEALDRRISSVYVRKWNWVSKKGWGSTGGAGKASTVRANWYYSWSAGYNTTVDQEYVPEKTHLYWPSWSEINRKDNVTCVLGLNEPEHSEQHTSDRCSCGGAINEWNAFNKLHTAFFESGLRIGSPAPTDASYLTNYITYCNNYAYRCDFVVTHAYWKEDIGTWRSRLEAIHKATGRPIWITELEPGASWDKPGYTDVASAAKRYQQIFDLMEELDYVERFVPYQDDLWYNAMLYSDGWPTPAGFIYRDYPSSHAYKADQQFIPVWWRPSLKEVKITSARAGTDGRATFVLDNPNGDMTDTFVIQYQSATGVWQDIYVEGDRSLFDTSAPTVTFDVSTLPTGQATFRLKVSTLAGAETVSPTVSVELIHTAIRSPRLQDDQDDAVLTREFTPDGRPATSATRGVVLIETVSPDGTTTVRRILRLE